MSRLKYGISKRVSLGKKEKFHGKLDSQRLASAAGAPRTSTSMRPNKTHFVFLHGQRPHACDAQVRLLCMHASPRAMMKRSRTTRSSER